MEEESKFSEEEIKEEQEKIIENAEKERTGIEEQTEEFLQSPEGVEVLKEMEEEEMIEDSEVLNLAKEKGITLPEAYKVLLTEKIIQAEKEKLTPELEEIRNLITELKNPNKKDERRLKEELVKKWLNL